MKNMQKSIQKVLLIASAMSVLAIQALFASQIASEVSNKIASETALANNERERERERVTPAQSLRNLGKWILSILSNPKRVI